MNIKRTLLYATTSLILANCSSSPDDSPCVSNDNLAFKGTADGLEVVVTRVRSEGRNHTLLEINDSFGRHNIYDRYADGKIDEYQFIGDAHEQNHIHIYVSRADEEYTGVLHVEETPFERMTVVQLPVRKTWAYFGDAQTKFNIYTNLFSLRETAKERFDEFYFCE